MYGTVLAMIYSTHTGTVEAYVDVKQWCGVAKDGQPIVRDRPAQAVRLRLKPDFAINVRIRDDFEPSIGDDFTVYFCDAKDIKTIDNVILASRLFDWCFAIVSAAD